MADFGSCQSRVLSKGRQGVLNTNNENKRSVKKKEKGEEETRGEGKGNEEL